MAVQGGENSALNGFFSALLQKDIINNKKPEDGFEIKNLK
jgi:hypothetical protein